MSAYRRRPGISENRMGNDLFLVDPASGEIHHLDATAIALWTLLAEPRDEAEIVATFAAAFPDQPVETLQSDLRLALHAMRDGGLIEIA
ncbi:MAG: HPr-rel-A system PqqD family peptide chaperone [Pseudomonadota bacterium]|nr:HPr-rel-A system PqqD family peptide chaperone [Pseudomonadota bacterium]